jgi:hypothetical protein
MARREGIRMVPHPAGKCSQAADTSVTVTRGELAR